MPKLKLAPLPMPQWAVPIQISVHNSSLPEKNRQDVNEGKKDSINHYDNALGIKASYTAVLKKEDIDAQFFTYPFFIVDEKFCETIENNQLKFISKDCMLNKFIFSLSDFSNE